MALSSVENLNLLARYNAWANERLFGACGRLHETEYLKARPSFFGSLHMTLNHILVADRVWLSRFTGIASGISALNQELYADFAGLHVARVAEDALILNYVHSLDDNILAGWLDYTNMAGDECSDEMSLLLIHFFNHQTHHRG